jgi:hypothetical protein
MIQQIAGNFLCNAPGRQALDMVKILLHVPSETEQVMPQEALRLTEFEDMGIGNLEYCRRLNSLDPPRVPAVRLTDRLTEGFQRSDIPENHPLSRRQVSADLQQSLGNQSDSPTLLMGSVEHLTRLQSYQLQSPGKGFKLIWTCPGEQLTAR